MRSPPAREASSARSSVQRRLDVALNPTALCLVLLLSSLLPPVLAMLVVLVFCSRVLRSCVLHRVYCPLVYPCLPDLPARSALSTRSSAPAARFLSLETVDLAQSREKITPENYPRENYPQKTTGGLGLLPCLVVFGVVTRVVFLLCARGCK